MRAVIADLYSLLKPRIGLAITPGPSLAQLGAVLVGAMLDGLLGGG